MRVRNARYNLHGGIDCEIRHPSHGWIPFTASPDDKEALGKDIYSKAVAGEYGEVGEIDAAAVAAEAAEAASAIVKIERAWRDAELARADVQINRIEDGDSTVTGLLDKWRAYRVALRAWPEHKRFPERGRRPAAPDSGVAA